MQIESLCYEFISVADTQVLYVEGMYQNDRWRFLRFKITAMTTGAPMRAVTALMGKAIL